MEAQTQEYHAITILPMCIYLASGAYFLLVCSLDEVDSLLIVLVKWVLVYTSWDFVPKIS